MILEVLKRKNIHKFGTATFHPGRRIIRHQTNLSAHNPNSCVAQADKWGRPPCPDPQFQGSGPWVSCPLLFCFSSYVCSFISVFFCTPHHPYLSLIPRLSLSLSSLHFSLHVSGPTPRFSLSPSLHFFLHVCPNPSFSLSLSLSFSPFSLHVSPTPSFCLSLLLSISLCMSVQSPAYSSFHFSQHVCQVCSTLLSRFSIFFCMSVQSPAHSSLHLSLHVCVLLSRWALREKRHQVL